MFWICYFIFNNLNDQSIVEKASIKIILYLFYYYFYYFYHFIILLLFF